MKKELNWAQVRSNLDEFGFSSLGQLLTPQKCEELIASYEQEALFRSRVFMKRHGFGSGEYQYFSYPLPELIVELRENLYQGLRDTAMQWFDKMGRDRYFPREFSEYLEECHETGQIKPTPLILKYGPGDYNCLHQDLYGNEIFPVQVAVCLSEREEDFTGGEFVLTHQRPRMQSRADVIPMKKGEAIAFAVNERPVRGTRGYYRVKVRHGVSRVLTGKRFVLGLIFHDAV